MSINDRLTQMVINSYIKEIRKQLQIALPSQAHQITEQILPLSDSLYKQNEALIVDEPGATNIRLTSLALASYRLLRQTGMERRAALSIVQTALVEPSRKKMMFFSRLAVRFWPDPLRLMAGISRNKARTAYGKAFIFEHHTDNMQTYFFSHVKKCLYHDFFKANSTPEMTPVFCAFDDNWSNAMQDPRSRLRFVRSTTIGAGDDMCRFEFRRTEGK
jgi:hypothetical protein